MGQALFDEVVMAADRHGLLSDEHFTVDGTLIEAAASLKSFRPRDGDPPSTTDGDSGNPRWTFVESDTHQSTTDPEARLLRKGKGKEAKLVFMAHALMENRHGMLTDFQVSSATGTAERDAVPVLLEQARERGFHPGLWTRAGQELRHAGVRGGDAGASSHAPRGPEHQRPQERH